MFSQVRTYVGNEYQKLLIYILESGFKDYRNIEQIKYAKTQKQIACTPLLYSIWQRVAINHAGFETKTIAYMSYNILRKFQFVDTKF